jgi:ribonuclease P protein component
MKRVIREIFRLNKTGFIGFDWVVQARTKFHNGSYDSIQEELLNAVRQMCARKN